MLLKSIFSVVQLILISTSFIYSQSSRITGIIKNVEQQPVAYANVLLLNAFDSSFVKGYMSDSSGYFQINDIPQNNCILKVQLIGYETYISGVIKNNIDTTQIYLISKVSDLKEVNVKAIKPIIEHHLDKMIVNIENSATAGGNTALELLEKSPGISVDQNKETISMLNKQGVIIYFNGRQSYMSGGDLIQYLRAMQADQISRIEIISNPSSKYDAAGNAGIINIVLKKDKSFGTNGTITTAAGKGIMSNSRKDLYRGSVSASINHRSKKIYIYSSLSLLRDGTYSERNINRNFNYDQIKSNFDQRMRMNQNIENMNLKTGVDYFITEKTTVGLGFDINLFKMNVNGTNSTDAKMNPMKNDQDFSIKQLATQSNPRQNINSNINIKHLFNNKGHNLSLDLDALKYQFHSVQHFDAQYYNYQQMPFNQLLQMGINTSDLQVFAGKLDYEKPIGEKAKLELGTKSSFVSINSELQFKEQVNNLWYLDSTKSNHFIYRETIHAIYGNYQKAYTKFSYQFGLRAEHTYTQGRSVTLSDTVKRKYLSLFPTAFTTYNLNKNNTLKLSYTRRLDRPRYDQLNPFILVIDPYSYATGNPYLKPQFTNTIELGYYYKSYALSFNYSKTNQLITELTIPNDSTKITRTQEANLNSMYNFSSSLYISKSIKKIWQINAQMIVLYKKFNDNNILGGELNISRWMCYLNVSNNFNLPRKINLEISGWYMTPFLEGIVVGNTHRFSVNAGMQKTFAKDKARIKVNISDIFLSSFMYGYVDYQNVNLTFNLKNSSRRFMLSFTYILGSQTVKSIQRGKTASDAEKERIAK